MKRSLALLAALLAGCGGGSSPDAALGPVELVERLREGGYVVYLRHAATDASPEDAPVVDFDDCRTQRLLNQTGRGQSRSIGRAFRDLGIPVGDVLSSEYCRARETAELAFGRYEDEPALTGFPNEGDDTYAGRVRATRELLARAPAERENTILVAHIKNLEAAAEVSVDEGGLAVFEPLGGTRFRHLGSLPAEAWPQLVEELG